MSVLEYYSLHVNLIEEEKLAHLEASLLLLACQTMRVCHEVLFDFKYAFRM
jgi:hypothetical protein